MKKILVLFVLLVFHFTLMFSQTNTTDFRVLRNEDCDFLNAQFYIEPYINSSLNYWDFGDGTKNYINYSSNTKHIYKLSGIYSVKLTSVINGDSIKILKENLIKVYKAPKANFEINPKDSVVFAPFKANFINKTEKGDGDGDSLTYEWDLGDNKVSNEVDPAYTYVIPGTFHIRLSVKDNHDCKSYFEKILTVKDSAQVNEVDYITGGCHGKRNGKSIYWMDYYIYKDTLKIVGILDANCCSIKTVSPVLFNDTVFIKQFETGDLCTCSCSFNFAIKIPDIFQDSIYFTIDDKTYLAKKRLIDGIKESNSVELFIISHNPVKEILNVEFSILNRSKVSIKVYDMIGREAKRIENGELKMENAGKHTISFDVGKLKSGVYFVRLSTDNDSRMVKFVKQ